MFSALLACTAPVLVESTQPLLNPGESEPALTYEGPGLLWAWGCDGAGVWLDMGPGSSWPYELSPDVLVTVWVSVSTTAIERIYRCEVVVPGRVDVVDVEVVVL